MPPYTGFTTDPPIIEAIIELCMKVGPMELTIAEGAGGIDTNLAFRISGYIELAERYGVNLVDLNECPTTTISVPEGLLVQELNVPNSILDCDVLINVPKLKLYRKLRGRGEWASLAIKNLLGALPGKGEYTDTKPSGFSVRMSREFLTQGSKYFHSSYKQWWSPRGEKKRIHANLAQGLVDISTVIKPAINIIDAVIVSDDVNMSDTKGMVPIDLSTIIASKDPLALDCIATQIAGLDASKISYLKHAMDRAIGESNPDKIQMIGTTLETVIETWETGLTARHNTELREL
ncbi:MAG: DUF362 domain-containing protein [Candidatus Thorarchaeota archaeon]